MRLCLRSAGRLRWRALVGLALLAGLVGGIALTAADGARRTDTAYPRLLRWSNASQLLVTPTFDGFGGFFGALSGLPQVRRMATSAFYDMALDEPGNRLVRNVIFEGSPDGAAGTSVDRARIISGHRFTATDPREVMIDKLMARRYHLHPGSTLRVAAYRQTPRGTRGGTVSLAFKVSAVVIFADEVVPATHELG